MKSASRMPDECEKMLHKLISRWWSMERAYIGMGAMCAADKNYPGFRNCFQLCSIRTRRCMEKVIQFLITRGSSLRAITVEPIVHIPQSLEGGMRKFLELSLKMETDMEKMLREGFLLAQNKGDITTCEFIDSGPLRREVRLIKWCVYHLTGLERCDNDYLYDRLAMSPIIEAWYKRVVNRPMSPFEMALTMSAGKPDNCNWTRYTNCTCRVNITEYVRAKSTPNHPQRWMSTYKRQIFSSSCSTSEM
ncbi:hypothetical protein AHF37_06447 [Paragonimus kellicotti]|nr:hypothetical protein AHF37_06447 [Paragonimus kellicotti]